MQTLDPQLYATWRRSADILERDRYGDKVLRLSDGTLLKLFRRKRWLSRALFSPPAQRFAKNAHALKMLGIPCPEVIAIYKLRQPERSVVHYHPLPGTTLRALITDRPLTPALINQLISFILHLHELGVYFRSLHLGNILLTPDGQLGLIDISDLRCAGKPLAKRMCRRNMKHLLRYTEDWDKFDLATRQRFEQLYTG